jgi:hypothetical protein
MGEKYTISIETKLIETNLLFLVHMAVGKIQLICGCI